MLGLPACALAALLMIAAPGLAATSLRLPQGTGSPFGQPEPAGAYAGFHFLAIDAEASVAHLTTALPSVSTTPRNRFVILQPDQRAELLALKAADPEVNVLMYKDLTLVTEPNPATGISSTGVDHAEAAAEGWLLRTKAGLEIHPVAFPYTSAARHADDAYVERWAGNVLGELRAAPWDGVFIDDANSTLRFHWPASANQEPSGAGDEADAAYDTDAEYAEATRAALAAIGPRIRAAGKLAIPNICCEEYTPGVWQDWLPYVSGALDEQFVKFGDGDRGLDTYQFDDRDFRGWSTHLELALEAERQGKYFLANTHSTARDVRAMRYGLATMLLATEGRSSFMHGADYGAQQLFPEYYLAQRLGAPVGPHFEFPHGVYRRDFEHGVVLVNPTLQSQGVMLGGSYSGSGLAGVSGATLESRSALLLEREDAR